MNENKYESIETVLIQDFSKFEGKIISTENPIKKYKIKAHPQAKGQYQKDEINFFIFYILTNNLKNCSNYAACFLSRRLESIEIDSKKFECGSWLSGNKYYLEVIDIENYDKNSNISDEIIDGEKLRNEIKLELKEASKNRRKELKEEKENNPPNIIKSVIYKKGFFEFKKSINQIPKSCYLNIPLNIKENLIKIKSNSIENTFYEVDVNAITCPCEHFKKNKLYLFDQSDPRRLCKHLASAIINKLKVPQSEIVYLLLSVKSKNEIKEFELNSGQKIYICKDKNNPVWVNVIARKRKKGEKGGIYTGDFETYSFNLLEKRWSHGTGPDGSSEIKNFL